MTHDSFLLWVPLLPAPAVRIGWNGPAKAWESPTQPCVGGVRRPVHIR
ncbi:MAG: hypothetical protein AB2693_30655 [Candidatus Thiodiazotropha sp.]